MEEILKPNTDVNCAPKSPMDKLMDDYKSACHEADFSSDSEDECGLCYDCARSELVSHGIGTAQSSVDCDRILSELDSSRYPGLWERVMKEKNSFLFTEILDQFHKENKSIVTKSKSSDEDDEALEKDSCDQLRLSCVREGLKYATTQEQLQKLRGITLDKDDYLHKLIDEKAALLPIETRKS